MRRIELSRKYFPRIIRSIRAPRGSALVNESSVTSFLNSLIFDSKSFCIIYFDETDLLEHLASSKCWRCFFGIQPKILFAKCRVCFLSLLLPLKEVNGLTYTFTKVRRLAF